MGSEMCIRDRNYAMCGRSFNPRFLFAYPNVKSGVMGAEQLAGVMEIVKNNSALKQNPDFQEKTLRKQLLHSHYFQPLLLLL